VAQASGEDWKDVGLALTTADLVQDTRLPELASLHLSRVQRPPRRGFRPAPEGLDAMFEGLDRFVAALPKQASVTPAPEAALRALAGPEEREVDRLAAGSAGLDDEASMPPHPQQLPAAQAMMPLMSGAPAKPPLGAAAPLKAAPAPAMARMMASQAPRKSRGLSLPSLPSFGGGRRPSPSAAARRHDRGLRGALQRGGRLRRHGRRQRGIDRGVARRLRHVRGGDRARRRRRSA
jgi:hypothetical protein